MEIKHREEWPVLIKLAKESSLSTARIVFLLALREVESFTEGRGKKGEEFNVKVVKGTNLEEQAKWVIGTIRANEFRYQKYILEKGDIDFVSFFAVLGGPYGTGWNTFNPAWWIIKMNVYMCLIGEEL